MLFSEKVKLEKQYLAWCEEQNKKIKGGKLNTNSFINVIAFLESIGFADVNELKKENDKLKERLKNAVEIPCIEPMTTWDWDDEKGIGESHFGEKYQLLYRDEDGEFIAYVGLDKETAEAELAKLKGGNNER